MISQLILSTLTSYRIDFRNFGTEGNTIEVSAAEGEIYEPAWAITSQGIGKLLQGSGILNTVKIKVINDGVLRISFRGQDKRYKGERLPIWVDYKSIKVNNLEISTKPVATWHDKPFKYEMPVKNGQEIILEFEQSYHQYREDELKDLLIKLGSDKNNIENMVKDLSSKGFIRTFAITKIYAPDNYLNIKKSYKLTDKLSYEKVKRGICIPPADEHGFYTQYISLGYILDTDCKYVLSSAMGRQKMYTRSDINVDVRCKNEVHKKAIYLGCFYNRYGHFICQGLSRLWFLLDNDYKDYDLIYVASGNGELPAFVGKLLSLFGVELSKLTRIIETTQYDEIIVPEVSFALNNFWTKEYKITIDKIKESILPIKNDKIYLSRCHFKDYIMGEKVIEKTFADNGYKIIYPEELSVDKQIAIISGANDIVTSTGTTAHNLIFAKNSAKCAILERGIQPNPTQPIINEMRNLDSSYVMANYSMLPVLPGSGLYVLGVNQYLQKFFYDNDIVYSKEIENEYLKYLTTYQYIWYKTYSNEKNYNELKIKNSNIPEDYLKTLLKGYEDMFSGKEIQIVSDKNLRSI